MRILYFCNCKKPCHSSCGCIQNGGPCSHTSDIEYSKNYTEVPIVADNPEFEKKDDGFSSVTYIEGGFDG